VVYGLVLGAAYAAMIRAKTARTVRA
jgi:hypothetical protein